MRPVYTRWDLRTQPDGRVQATLTTGADPAGAQGQRFTFEGRAQALAMSGVSRTGLLGHSVQVSLDGQRLGPQGRAA
jgi:hypothetical protein